MKQLKVISDSDHELEVKGLQKRERLKITSAHPDFAVSRDLFASLGTMHLAAPYLPEKISTNFAVNANIAKLIEAMYRSEKRSRPEFTHHLGPDFLCPTSYKTSSKKAVVAFSAGKDSLWNMWWAQKKYGKNNVLCAHINGLNKHNGSSEREFTKRQVKRLGFKHFQMISLLNSSKNGGYEVMRSRDMFLMSLIIPYALQFGASQIITEGFAETDNEKEPFTGQEGNMQYFNKVLSEMGIPVQVAWRNRKEMDVTKDLLLHAPGWMPHVCNCFSAPCYMPERRRYWRKHASRFPLYDSQCGSCVKCRITNLARILHDPGIDRVPRKHVRIFLENTHGWMKRNRERLSDMIEGSFARDFSRASKKYGLEFKSTP